MSIPLYPAGAVPARTRRPRVATGCPASLRQGRVLSARLSRLARRRASHAAGAGAAADGRPARGGGRRRADAARRRESESVVGSRDSDRRSEFLTTDSLTPSFPPVPRQPSPVQIESSRDLVRAARRPRSCGAAARGGSPRRTTPRAPRRCPRRASDAFDQAARPARGDRPSPSRCAAAGACGPKCVTNSVSAPQRPMRARLSRHSFEIDVGRRRRRQDEAAGLQPDAGRVADERDAACRR